MREREDERRPVGEMREREDERQPARESERKGSADGGSEREGGRRESERVIERKKDE